MFGIEANTLPHTLKASVCVCVCVWCVCVCVWQKDVQENFGRVSARRRVSLFVMVTKNN